MDNHTLLVGKPCLFHQDNNMSNYPVSSGTATVRCLKHDIVLALVPGSRPVDCHTAHWRMSEQ